MAYSASQANAGTALGMAAAAGQQGFRAELDSLRGRMRRRGFSHGEIAAEVGRPWAGAGYHGFSADNGTWSAVGSAGEVFTGATPDELGQKIRAHWQAMQ
jgi:hypothetical protein